MLTSSKKRQDSTWGHVDGGSLFGVPDLLILDMLTEILYICIYDTVFGIK